MNKFKFDQVKQNLNKLKADLPIILANDAQKFFVNRFREEGWEDGGLKKWKPRATPDKKGKRNLLVKSGALRRAVNNSIRGVTFDKIRLVVDLPYAAIHNEGGVINVKERNATLSFARHGANGLRFTKGKTAKGNTKKNVVAQAKVKIGAHTINMPQRKYMGDSKELRVIQRAKIIKAIDKIWRG